MPDIGCCALGSQARAPVEVHKLARGQGHPGRRSPPHHALVGMEAAACMNANSHIMAREQAQERPMVSTRKERSMARCPEHRAIGTWMREKCRVRPGGGPLQAVDQGGGGALVVGLKFGHPEMRRTMGVSGPHSGDVPFFRFGSFRPRHCGVRTRPPANKRNYQVHL